MCKAIWQIYGSRRQSPRRLTRDTLCVKNEGLGSILGGLLNPTPTATARSAALAYEYMPYDGPIVDRKYAIGAGLKRYFTGKPCKHGHISERQTEKANCIACMYEWRHKEENREKVAKMYSVWQKKNKEKVKIRNKRWSNNNRNSAARRSAKWRAKNPLKVAEINRVKNNKRRLIEGTFTKYDICLLLKVQNYKCVYCLEDIGKNKKWHLDHIMPVSLGGTNWPENLQALCKSCNLRKSNKHPDIWHREIGWNPPQSKSP